MAGAVRKAKKLAASIPGAWMPDQFVNPTNSAYHDIEGIGDGFISENLDLSVVEKALPVSDIQMAANDVR